MISNVKSSFIFNKIINFLGERTKLLLFTYNKNIQKKLNINIIDYILFSKILKIAERNGKGKEYSAINKKLMFEGEYKNGKRNGIGTCFYGNGKICFKGNYKDGILNGKGIDYYYNGNIEFDGEYVDGYRYNGKGYDLKNNIVYELKNGNGYIKIFNLFNELIFEGEYKDGVKNGKGKEFNHNGKLIFEGEYLNGRKWNGYFIDKQINHELKKGKGHINSSEFEGEYLNGKKHGKAKEYYSTGKLKFEGEYLNGKKIGNGKEYDLYGRLDYEGEYLNDEKNGKGKEYYSNGKLLFEGEYLYNYRRRGKQYNIKGKVEYEGEYLFNNKWTGKGYDDEGNVIYELYEGKGNMITFYNNGKISFEGILIKGEKNGFGKEYDENGYLIFDGEYKDDLKWNGKRKEYLDAKLIFEAEIQKGIIIYSKLYDKNNILEFKNGNGYTREYGLIQVTYLLEYLEFEGEFIDGIKNGKGKEYSYFGDLKYEGEYFNGKRHGKGKEYNNFGDLKYEGEYFNGERHGKGKEYNNFGTLIFEGEYINGKRKII